MLSNYFAAALRNLARNKLYAGISIAGLAVGLAAAILIALFVRDELSYDRFISGHQRVYRVSTMRVVSDSSPFLIPTVAPDVAAWMKLDYPAIQATARLAHTEVGLRQGDFEANAYIAWADPDIFTVLPLKAVAGDLKTALERSDGIVLTREMARKFFGRDDPIGETIEINRRHSMQVTAVLEDLPSNTHLEVRIFASGKAAFSRLSELDAMPQSAISKPWETTTYIRLADAASVDELAGQLPDFMDRHVADIEKASAVMRLMLIPIGAIHLYAPGAAAMVYAVAAIGLLIVLLASINFVNLMTARAARRSVEVGVRKALGVNRSALIVQFIGESLLHVALSMLLALALVELLLPYFNAFLGRTIVFNYWRSPQLAASVVGAVLMVGTLAGLYPAAVLSSFRPALVLKGRVGGWADSGAVRQALVIAQFAVLICLMVAAGTLYRQTVYATRDSLRFEQDQILLINGGCATAFKDQVRALPGVQAASCSLIAPLFNTVRVPTQLQSGALITLHQSAVDVGFLELYGFKPLAGRFFSAGHYADASPADPKVVINETAMRQLGYASPEDAIGHTISLSLMRSLDEEFTGPNLGEIIGVVADFPMGSVQDPIGPTVFYIEQALFQLLNVRLSGRQTPGTLEAIDRLWKRSGNPRPISRFFLNQHVEDIYRDIIRQTRLLTVLAGVAVFIACLGLFGLSAFTAERRTQEIGVRKAMGAGTAHVLHLLIWQFTKPVLWANLIAWPIAGLLMNRWLQGFAYHIDLEPWIFVASTALALVIALLTVSAHCYLVARAKPVAALRCE